ncbi:multicopper oxidase family protein [Salinicoccus jeotgali]
MGAFALALVIILSACGISEAGEAPGQNSDGKMGMHDDSMNGNSESPQGGEMGMGGMGNQHMDHDDVAALDSSSGDNELNIPPVLKSDSTEETKYTVRAKMGETEIFDGTKTQTYGYNGDFLGPVLQFEKGETVTINLINELDVGTTFHWHGLKIPGEADGGPHNVIEPGEEDTIKFEVTQEAATLWFHPHPDGDTSEQVYKGLAGLIYIEDENIKELDLPDDYGKNDFPLIFQDRTFDEDKQLNYDAVMNEDGTVGDVSLINGTVNPKLTVGQEKVRLRLLNGSNARNYTFKMNTGDTFAQIATDGGLLNEPVEMEELTLTPSERAEIVIDFSKIDDERDVALVNDSDDILLPFEVTDEAAAEIDIPDKMNQFSVTEAEKDLPVTKEVELFGMMDMVTINGKKFDPERIDFTQERGVTEVWEIYNKPDMMGGMIHPFHIHGAQFKTLSRDGEAPPRNERGWKDTISVSPDETVRLAVQFNDKGVYMFHCHILEHEDNGMMGQIKVE